MNIYFVTPAPAQSGDIRVLQDDKKTPIVSFLDQEEANDFAQRMARRYPGNQFWVMEGTATKAFITDPLPVRKCTPAVGEF
ncbi:hypothetical protein NJB95_21615 [Brucella intermedia]|uniref:hypothetical protein n=1 Tax=Brucella intermedia TaxID=94625 RepID=UPI00209ABF2E|nr:hypothetical protein [Brucella intermedia]MCO7739178.1 hypothetical protein [Brucella intermedia]